MSGWIKLHRKITDSAVFDNEKILKVFIYCLTSASHKDHDQLVGNQIVHLKPGQFIFGRKVWSERLKIKERTLYDYMKTLESLQIININSNNKFSVVTIVNWGVYQLQDDDNQQQTNNKPTTNQQQTNTNKNVKNEKNEKNKDIVAYLNLKAGKEFKHTTKKTQSFINARLEEGFTIDDFKKVIDIKCSEWKNSDMNKYLRPETLFSTKFESYLNQDISYKKEQTSNDEFNLDEWGV
ncbi:conserved phage C-terminal domain-containing protein [Macrococcus armenti]|uniref:conserved phage C-terminal domain-containing protein n=1 Tax=Macrococcus armenti TaxID=2875764 RepID=UPI001CCB5F90|nr:conserved phage C-terminal domain-containing protein [Macrococcus armenti]UBH21601.1 conserved phage C-terminal domain-containing protein [Macrococcus armenti]